MRVTKFLRNHLHQSSQTINMRKSLMTKPMETDYQPLVILTGRLFLYPHHQDQSRSLLGNTAECEHTPRTPSCFVVPTQPRVI